ncbi:hypothetical protein B296_00049326 [Ensete ventricosum]|uniref:Uncharacterized protein n=1 Tax=Ensete ventricosum TaxID=4639 RepID=A0A426WZ95_ENSVE|nr:hypothetical protein B296_00049326 [Ensete ventricosum]
MHSHRSQPSSQPHSRCHPSSAIATSHLCHPSSSLFSIVDHHLPLLLNHSRSHPLLGRCSTRAQPPSSSVAPSPPTAGRCLLFPCHYCLPHLPHIQRYCCCSLQRYCCCSLQHCPTTSAQPPMPSLLTHLPPPLLPCFLLPLRTAAAFLLNRSLTCHVVASLSLAAALTAANHLCHPNADTDSLVAVKSYYIYDICL